MIDDPTVLHKDDIRRFTDAMMYKLRRNAHKGRWEGMTLKEAVERLEDEVKELRAAIAEGNSVEILLEAADVGNFAMIAAHIAIEGTDDVD